MVLPRVGVQDRLEGCRKRGRIMPGGAVGDRDRREHEPRTQRFCRTTYRFGVAYRFPVGKNYVRA